MVIRHSLTYRPDIEGLRAIAVVLVIMAHAGLPGAVGGFIGVDIFFVISGYLITGLLVQEFEQHGSIDLARFYAKRIRRLVPALLLMVAVTALLGWQLLPRSEHVFQAIAGASAVLWLSNMHFALGDIDYFGPDASANLYLHTWSLGVEEQFYLAWPVLISLFFFFGFGGWGARRRLVLGMTVLAVASFLVCVWLAERSPPLAFYLMPTRAWQFAVGAVLYLLLGFSLSGDTSAEARTRGLVVGMSGVAIIAIATLLVDGNTPYPGVYALLPVAGTVFLIAAGMLGTNPATTFLSLRPMQFIGNISYAWYLWHWPVLKLGAAVGPIHSPWWRTLLVVVSFILAYTSWKIVESPFRRNDWVIRMPSRMIIGSLAFMLVGVWALIQWTNDAKLGVAEMAGGYRPELPVIYSMGCDRWYQDAALTPCYFGGQEATRTAVMIGDSVGAHWFPALEQIFAAPDWRLIVLTKSACAMVDRPYHYSRVGREYSECEEWRNSALEYAAALSPDIVLLGSADTYEFTGDDWKGGTRSVIEKIAPHAAKVFLIRSTPMVPFNAASCLEKRGYLYRRFSLPHACAAPLAGLASEPVYAWQGDAAEGWEHVEAVDLNALVCPDSLCRGLVNGMVTYRDSRHLDPSFVRSLAPGVADRFGVLEGAGP